jgi:anti-sigma B factor antagonist
MNFEVSKKENYTLIAANVEKLDAGFSEELKAVFDSVIAEKGRNIIFDLSKTRFCDSSALSAMLIGHRLCKAAKGSFIISGISAPVKKIITIAKLNQVLKFVPTIPEAVDYLFMEEIERQLDLEE